MLSPKFERFADRLEDLIDEGGEVAKLAKFRDGIPNVITGRNKRHLNAWLAKVDNILQSAFGTESAHHEQFNSMQERGVNEERQIHSIIGILEGALDDLREGFLVGQEFLIAGEVFDSVLEQARHLNENHFQDPAAVLGRVVLEDALERIAREEGVDVDQKASEINTQLWKSERYSKPRWRRIQSWLDVGNAAAHGDFDEYTQADVEDQLNGVEEFLAKQLHP